jgi:hypothetical protein
MHWLSDSSQATGTSASVYVTLGQMMTGASMTIHLQWPPWTRYKLHLQLSLPPIDVATLLRMTSGVRVALL